MVGTEKDSSAINYLPAFQKYLHFNEHYFSYAAKNDFDSKHSFGILIFSKYPIINTQTISDEKQNYNETFQYTDIVKDEDTIRVFNIHLQSLKFSKANLEYIKDAETEQDINLEASKNIISKFKTGFIARASQSEKIKNEMNHSPYPVIVCGDFNDVPNSYAYNYIGANLHNAFAEKGSGIGRTFSGISPTLRIDNIFTDKVFNIVQYTCIQKKLSDHFPIMVDVNFSNNQSLNR
jgi:endonuclease/exonuclease/phosphatase family metal-dependent hydrolase